jgi:hypothetical protein
MILFGSGGGKKPPKNWAFLYWDVFLWKYLLREGGDTGVPVVLGQPNRPQLKP